MFKRLLDLGVVTALIVYVLAGVPLVPFHGDEATQIYMSRDYAYQFLQRDLALVRYRHPPISPQEQDLRLLNGTINKYLIGLAWHVGGFTLADINQQWDWGADWNYNQTTGHAPSAALLNTARVPSGVLLAGGVALLFALCHALGGRWAAYLGAVLYAFNPALLVNGRRAMMEGSFVFFSLAVVLAGVWFVSSKGAARGMSALVLGAAAGAALASKHTALFAVAAVFGVCMVSVLACAWRARRVRAAAGLVPLAAAMLVACLVFLALNPAWWDHPIDRLFEVLARRQALLVGQTTAFGGYADAGAALAGWLEQAAAPPPQYYEVAAWGGYIGDQIAAYAASGLAGTALPGVIMLAAAGVGCIRLVQVRTSAAWVVGGWSAVMALSTLLLTPLLWQRYYLPVQIAVVVLAAVGTSALITGQIWRAPASPAPSLS